MLLIFFSKDSLLFHCRDFKVWVSRNAVQEKFLFSMSLFWFTFIMQYKMQRREQIDKSPVSRLKIIEIRSSVLGRNATRPCISGCISLVRINHGAHSELWHNAKYIYENTEFTVKSRIYKWTSQVPAPLILNLTLAALIAFKR